MFNHLSRILALFFTMGCVLALVRSFEFTPIKSTPPLLQQGPPTTRTVNLNGTATPPAEQPKHIDPKKTESPIENKVKNGTFESDTTYWFGFHKDNLTLTVDEGVLKAAGVVGNPAWLHFETTVGQITAGKTYYVSFDIRTDQDNTPIDFYLRKHRAPHHELSDVQIELIGRSSRTIEHIFTATTDEIDSSLLVFEVDTVQTVWVDNVVLYERSEEPSVSASLQPIIYDFETAAGWTVNPNSADTATTGQWERVDSQKTESEGNRYQNESATSGSYALMTGGGAGNHVGDYDIDNGATSILSPQISLPDGSSLTVSFSYYLAHDSDSTADDYLRLSWVSGHTKTTILEEYGTNDIDQAFWTRDREEDMSRFAGQTGYLLIEAADGGDDGIIEAAIDDIRIVTVP